MRFIPDPEHFIKNSSNLEVIKYELVEWWQPWGVLSWDGVLEVVNTGNPYISRIRLDWNGSWKRTARWEVQAVSSLILEIMDTFPWADGKYLVLARNILWTPDNWESAHIIIKNATLVLSVLKGNSQKEDRRIYSATKHEFDEEELCD